MAEFSPGERPFKAALGPVLLCVWWCFAPDYSTFLYKPLGRLTITEISWCLLWLLLLLPLLYAAVCWLYEAVTGRDSVWFWHPD